MGYVSPKASSVSSFSFPKSSSFSSPKSNSYSSSKVNQGRNINDDIFGTHSTSPKNNLNAFRDLLTSYLEINEQIELTTANLQELNRKKRILEEKIASNPEYEIFATLFNSMKGPRK